MSWDSKRKNRILDGIIPLFFFYALGCGKPTPVTPPPPPPPEPPAPLPVPGIDEMVQVRGSAAFGNQCPYGIHTTPTPIDLELWGCPMKMNTIELLEPLQALMLKADCRKKEITVRTERRGLDSPWEVMPDGSFSILIDGGTARIKDDGEGQVNCLTPLTASLSGKLDCSDPDPEKAKIPIEVVWWTGKTVDPVDGTPNPEPLPVSGSRCKLPEGCYFYGSTEIKQCQ